MSIYPKHYTSSDILLVYLITCEDRLVLPNSKIDINNRPRIYLPSLKTVIISLSLGLVIGYIGPFGSFNMPLVDRLFYWVLLIGAGHFIFSQTDKLCHYYLDNNKLPPLITPVVSSLIGALLLSFFVEFVSHVFFNLELRFPENFLFFYPQVFLLSLIINILSYLINSNQALKNHSKPNSPPGVHFIRRIPKKLGDDLICFCMEDHYLHVYTAQGDYMMLLRMKDALMELKDYHGFQVHRSWWVATDAIVDVQKQPRKATLTMKNNMQVPVSQKYLPQLKQQGLI